LAAIRIRIAKTVFTFEWYDITIELEKKYDMHLLIIDGTFGG